MKRTVLPCNPGSHREKFYKDQQRRVELEEVGVRFLRFDDKMVKKDMGNVLRAIQIFIEENDLTHP